MTCGRWARRRRALYGCGLPCGDTLLPRSGQLPQRGRLLRIAAATLIGEGVLVTANHGDCPMGGLQEKLGDPVPLFELVLSPRAAKRAVPTLGAITAFGLALLAVRGRRGKALRQSAWPQVRGSGAETGQA